MKLLRVKATNFKNCSDDYTIDLVAKSKKTAEDKEYELQEIADGLFTFNTVVVAGKNASGKTSALNLLEMAYEILETFRLDRNGQSLNGVELEIVFFCKGYVYKYETVLKNGPQPSMVYFENQRLYEKKYYKSNVASLYEFAPEEEKKDLKSLPKDTSSVFDVVENQEHLSICFNQHSDDPSNYSVAYMFLEAAGNGEKYLPQILKVFDKNIESLERLDYDNYRISFAGEEKVLSINELYYLLSSGTTKGIAFYSAMVLSLIKGYDLLIDEIENHFHKSLVENMISLYKDKKVNKHNATLIFSTHYPELLDDIGRQDNVFICKTGKKVSISSMYEGYDVRNELLKSKQYLNNVFGTAVDYDDLMDLKKALMQ